MKYITDYKELHGNINVSLLDHLSEKPIEGKQKILSYLKNGKSDGVRCSGIFDYVDNDPQFDTIHLFTDGEYYWNSEEIYHFEKYNMKLDDDFVKKVLSNNN